MKQNIMKTMYRNDTTYEVTSSQATAVQWFRNGNNVSIWSEVTPDSYQKRLTWEH